MIDENVLKIAHLVSKSSTCIRRNVGCVLTNEQGHIIATGYNGVASGLPHCNDGVTCPGGVSESGRDLDKCDAIHAEQNALLQCSDVSKIWTCYVTHSPCVTCVKLLMNTGVQRILFSEHYPHPRAMELAERANIEWRKI